jgi:hypothetical protein
VIGATESDGIYRKVGSRFNVSSDAVRLYVDRVTHAILDALECDAVYWPKVSERKFISERIEEQYGFPNCIGFADGTILPLEFKHNLYGEEHYCQKGCYGLNCLVICDDELQILDYLVGWPASVHDNRVWKSTKQMSTPCIFFIITVLVGGLRIWK